jgi:hypothetical protein
MSRALDVILATYPSELYLDQVSLLLNGTELETLALLESGELPGRQLDGSWFVLREHVAAFILGCRSRPSANS